MILALLLGCSSDPPPDPQAPSEPVVSEAPPPEVVGPCHGLAAAECTAHPACWGRYSDVVFKGCSWVGPEAQETLEADQARCAETGGVWSAPKDRRPRCQCSAGDEPVAPGEGIFDDTRGCLTHRAACEAAEWRWVEAVVIERAVLEGYTPDGCLRQSTSNHRNVKIATRDDAGVCTLTTYEPAHCVDGEEVRNIRIVRKKLTGQL